MTIPTRRGSMQASLQLDDLHHVIARSLVLAHVIAIDKEQIAVLAAGQS